MEQIIAGFILTSFWFAFIGWFVCHERIKAKRIKKALNFATNYIIHCQGDYVSENDIKCFLDNIKKITSGA